MYKFTNELAALEPPPAQMQALFAALRGNQEATNAFLSAISGAIPIDVAGGPFWTVMDETTMLTRCQTLRSGQQC